MSNSDTPLPEIVAEIAAVAGADAAWAIVRARGGQQVFIPARAREDHWLAQLVGMDAARKICDHFGTNDQGSLVLIPMAAAAQRSQRWTEALASDATVNELAATMRVHRRTVFRHRANTRSDDPDQGNLPL